MNRSLPIHLVSPLLAAVLGFVAAPAAQPSRPYRVIDLGVPIGQSPSAGVVASGASSQSDHVVGFSVWEPFRWQRGVGMQPLRKLPGYVSAGALGVTDTGIAVGRCGLDTGSWETFQAVWWDPNGVVTSLTQPGWAYSIAVDVNANGIVLVSVGVPVGSGAQTRVFLGPLSGPLTQLVPGVGVSVPFDLNENGQVCLTADGVGDARYTPGVGLQPMPFSVRRLNDHGQVAGIDTSVQFVARYTDGVGVHVFSTPGTTFHDVGGIDSFGQIVATRRVRTSTSPPRYDEFGYLLSDAIGVRRLDAFVDHPVPVRIGEVVAIGDDGSIAATGSIGSDNRAMLLEPRFLHVHGRGCVGSNGVTRMIAVGDTIGGGRLALLAAGGRPSGAGFFALSGGSASLPIPGGCTVTVDPASAVFVAVTLDGIGQGRLTTTLPIGVAAGSVQVQFVGIDPTMPFGVVTSNGVRIDVP